MYALEDLEKAEELGRGTYGTVFKVRDRRNGHVLALKIMPFSNDNDGVPISALREIAILKELKGEHIVRLIDVLSSQTALCLLFEYCMYDLNKFMETKQGKLDALEVKNVMRQLLEAIVFLHKNRIIHRDLKPENILLTKEGILKLADFGLAVQVGLRCRSLSTEVVTLWYRAPEILLGAKVYDGSIDVWSAGCIFAEIVNDRNALFQGSDAIEQLQKIFSIIGTPTEESWPGISSLPKYDEFIAASNGICHKHSRLSEVVTKLNTNGMSLLTVFVCSHILFYS